MNTSATGPGGCGTRTGAEVESLDWSTRSTLDHIDQLADRADQLTERRQRLCDLQAESERQVIHRTGIQWRAGVVSPDQVRAVHNRLQSRGTKGWYGAWIEAGLPSTQRMDAWIVDAPNMPDGSWYGETRHPGKSRPPAGQAVVYVLYDKDLNPCYVGSTGSFASRLGGHRHANKTFASWRAWPCRDREHAYEREVQMLTECMPYLNRKAAR